MVPSQLDRGLPVPFHKLALNFIIRVSMKEEVTLNRKDQNRLVVMNQIEGRKLKVDKAAALLEVTRRHIWSSTG